MRSSDWIRNEPKPKISQVPKTRKKPVADLPESGCHNCRNWRPPSDPDDDFGTCRVVVTLTRRVRNGPEKGTCIPIEQIARTNIIDYDMMQTARHFRACELYLRGDVQDADTRGDRDDAIHGHLFDQVASRRLP